MFKKRILWLAISLLPTFSFAQNVTKVEISLPKERIMYQIYNGTGVVMSDLSSKITASSTGILTDIPTYPNNFVSKDQVIVEISGPSSKAEYTAAKMSYERDEALFHSKIIASEKFELAKVHYEKALQQYQDNIIKAPFDGKIGIIRQKVGDKVIAGEHITTIVNGGHSHLYVDMPAKLLLQVKISDKAQIIDEDEQVLNDLEIVSVDPYISDISDNFTIKLISQSGPQLVHGTFVNVKIIYDAHQAITVPEQALMYDVKGSYLYFVIDNKIVKQYVKTGIRLDDQVEILDQLALTDQIVVEGNQKVKDNMPVEVMKFGN